MVQQSLSIMTKKKMSVGKKVTWNRHQMVLVIYERDIPLHISCSSLLLQRFLSKFDDEAEQYLRDVMKRKNYHEYVLHQINMEVVIKLTNQSLVL